VSPECRYGVSHGCARYGEQDHIAGLDRFGVQTWAQRRAAPARTALILSSEPVFAGLFAFILKGETLRPLGWVGAAVIVAAIVSVQLAGLAKASRTAAIEEHVAIEPVRTEPFREVA